MDISVEVASGKHTATFTLSRADATANRVADLIREAFVVPQGADVPAVTYQDDEGDTISLNLGVAVEFGEALRVMELGSAPLRFKLVQALEPRAPKPQPTAAAAAAASAEPNTAAVDAEKIAAANAARYAAELEEHARARECYEKDCAAYKKEVEAHVRAMKEYKEKEAAAPAAPPAPVGPMQTDAAGVVTQISTLLQGYTAGMAERVTALETELAAQRRRAAAAEALSAERTAALQSSKQQLQAATAAHRMAESQLQERITRLNSTCTELAAEHQAFATTTQEKHNAETKGLVDTIAELREALSTQGLEVKDLQKENASLREQLEAVFGKIAGLLPDTARTPSPFVKAVEKVVKGVEDFTGAVSAVTVATSQEVTEAVRGTHNYAASSPEAAAAPAAAKQGGGAAAAAAAQAQAPSEFVQMMDAKMDDAMKELEGELAATEAASAAAAAAAAPAVSDTDRRAFCRIREMGFDISQERVSQLMTEHDQDITRVINQLFG